MSQNTSVFHLEVQQIESSCRFQLSWGEGQKLNVTFPFSAMLSLLYEQWSTNYLHFYQTTLRGRAAGKGVIAAPNVDWHAKLVDAETKLLYEFHQWLRSGELYDIRSILEQAVIQKSDSLPIDLFLTCNPLDMERLPWEAWEIGMKFAATGRIRIVRKPWNILEPTKKPRNGGRKARILAILGDDTGLDFRAEKEALKSLARIATIEFVGWQPGKDIESLKSEIVNAITNQYGWDVLFFAGHSNETELNGGELAIAPNVSLFLQELAPSLTIAKERGLQFALFNSCKGLSLANALINLGLSQVAVMREPIHNQVAEEFLVQFLQRLADYADVHEALLAACQYLKLEKHLTYPSASLIPSLFRHPNAELFRFKRFGLIHKIKPWFPKKQEAIAFATLAFMSWQLPVQSILLRQRVLAQAIYRQSTNQVPTTKNPPVLLVEIDDESIQKAKISNPTPMNRKYLAQLVDKLSTMNSKVVGFDYVLDRYQQENDQKLATSLQAAVQNQGTWFVFASMLNNENKWLEVVPELAHPNWSLRGDLRGVDEDLVYMKTAPIDDTPFRRSSLAYLLALAHRLNFDKSVKSPHPTLQSSSNWLSQVKVYVKDNTNKDYKDLFSSAARVQPLTQFSYQFKQMWLKPIMDFSIPPEQVYQSIPAWKLLESSSKLPQSIVLIAPGGHSDAGITGRGEDNFPLPPAIKYWRTLKNSNDLSRWFPGGGVHAYMIHHFLNQRIVTPIPDLWLVIIAALLGKGIILTLEKINEEKTPEKEQQFLWLLPDTKGKWLVLLTSGSAIYGLVSLQLYISAAIVLPFVLPTATIWSFVLLYFLKKIKTSHS